MSSAGGIQVRTVMPIADRAANLNRWRSKSLAEKATLALGMLALALLLPPFPAAPVIVAIMTGAALIGARVPPGIWFALAAGPLAFMLTGAAMLTLQIDATGFSLAPNGLAVAAGVIARSSAALSCLLFLALTTPVTDLLAGMRRLGLPVEVTEVALLTYRFIFLLADTAVAMDAAQAARLGHDGFRRRLRSLGMLAANLLPRAMDRARRLEIGLCARGYEGEMRVLSQGATLSVRGMIVVLAVVAATGVIGVLFS
jgi:cobalt/nickel transport system permease protein